MEKFSTKSKFEMAEEQLVKSCQKMRECSDKVILSASLGGIGACACISLTNWLASNITFASEVSTIGSFAGLGIFVVATAPNYVLYLKSRAEFAKVAKKYEEVEFECN